MTRSPNLPLSFLALFLFGACPETLEEPCEVDCSLLEYCGASACDACPALCNNNTSNTGDAGNNAAPVTTDAGNNTTPITTDAGNNTTPITTDAGNNTTPVTTDAGTGNAIGDAGVSHAINCATLQSVTKSWGGTSGPCGPSHELTIYPRGDATQRDEDAYPPQGSTQCADATVTHYTTTAQIARNFNHSVCEDYNANYTPIQEMCVGAYSYWSFSLTGGITVTTSNMSCGNNSMIASDNAYDTFITSLVEVVDAGN